MQFHGGVRVKTFSAHVMAQIRHDVSESGLFTHEKVCRRDLERTGGADGNVGGWECGREEAKMACEITSDAILPI